MVCREDTERFADVCRDALAFERATPGSDGVGIGQYNEKKMHAALKRFVCEREECYEVNMGKRYVADILCDGEIYEIQTASLYPLTQKLAYYIENTDCHITVVHPIAAKRRKIWINPETGETTAPTRTYRAEGRNDALAELVYISEQIATGRVGVWFLFIEEEEYRFLNGWSRDKKRGSERFERVPVALLDELAISSPQDCREFLPDTLPRDCDFTASEFGKALGMHSSRDVYRSLIALCNLGILAEGDKRGRARTWHVLPES